jgi:hypothetical protein
MAVNNHGFDGDGRPSAITESTAQGGYLGRSIIAIAAPTNYRYVNRTGDSFQIDMTQSPWFGTWYGNDLGNDQLIGDDDDGDGDADVLERGIFNGSSASTPAVAGAAALVREQVIDEIGSNIENPGVLYATMLLLGDRRTGPTTFTTVGYDAVWGAGSLKVRMFNAIGLDGPAGYRAGSVCVGDGESVTVHIDPSGSGGPEALPTAVDLLKLVTWTYSKGHDNAGSGSVGGIVPDVRLTLHRLVSPTLWVSDAADTSADNKKRIVKLGGVGGEAWRFSLTGVNVGANTGDDKWPTCAAGRVRVWYAWLYEDDAREPGEVPECVGSEVTP